MYSSLFLNCDKYFIFCYLQYSYERNYKSLLDCMIKNDLALKGNFDGVELLIFSSNQLPEKSQRKAYLVYFRDTLWYLATISFLGFNGSLLEVYANVRLKELGFWGCKACTTSAGYLHRCLFSLYMDKRRRICLDSFFLLSNTARFHVFMPKIN